MRNNGVVKRSFPYIILERKYPLTQLSPLFTGASGSPCVATTLPFWVPTNTPHPVPQKRQGAFSHLILVASLLAIMLLAEAGNAMPAAVAAAAIACAFINSRLVKFIVFPRYSLASFFQTHDRQG